MMMNVVLFVLDLLIRFIFGGVGVLVMLVLQLAFYEWFLTKCNDKATIFDPPLPQQQQQQPEPRAIIWRLVFELLTSKNDDLEDHSKATADNENPVCVSQTGHRHGRNRKHLMTLEYVEEPTGRDSRHQSRRELDGTADVDSTMSPSQNDTKATTKDGSARRQNLLPLGVWNRFPRIRSVSAMSSSAAEAGLILSYVELAKYETSLHRKRDGVNWPPKPGDKLYWTLSTESSRPVLGRPTPLPTVYLITLEKIAATDPVDDGLHNSLATPEVTSSSPESVGTADGLALPTPPESEKHDEQDSVTSDEEEQLFDVFPRGLTDDVIDNTTGDDDSNLTSNGNRSRLETSPNPAEFIDR